MKNLERKQPKPFCKKVYKVKKRIPTWAWFALMFIVVLGMSLTTSTMVTRSILEDQMIRHEKVSVIDQNEFKELQKYITKRYDACASASYILQPKADYKIYKSLFYSFAKDSTQMINISPKVSLSGERKYQLELKNNGWVSLEESKDASHILDNNSEFKTGYSFTIYQFEESVGELIILFKEHKQLSNKELEAISSDVQVLSNLLL